LNPGININPANYTHRQILVGVKMLGAKRILTAIIEEVKSQTETGNGSVVLDAASALICAPDPQSWDNGAPGIDVLGAEIRPLQRRMNLREALKNEAEAAPKMQKTDAFHAETVVRLYRKVEAQLQMPQQTLMSHDALDIHQALDSAALDGAMAGVGSLDGMGANDMMGDGMGDSDLMHGLLGSGADLLDGFGTGELGDGMGF
jgi:mediator of RNA polymerase II transcription subunit 5